MVKALESPVVQVAAIAPLNVVVTQDDSGVDTPLVQEVAIPAANTEQSLAIPAGTRRFLVRLLDGKLSLAYVAGGPYFTVNPGGAIGEEGLSAASAVTLYFKSSKAADTLQVETWV